MKLVLGFLILTLLVLAGVVYARVCRRRTEAYMQRLKKEMEKF